MSVSLALIHHDPDGRLNKQLAAVLPLLQKLFIGIAVHASPQANQQALSQLADVGATITTQQRVIEDGIVQIGRVRREVIEEALRFKPSHVMYCDGDRLFHWAEQYASELQSVVKKIEAADFTVLGRTMRAFDSHPRIQRDTEQLINHVFEVQSGLKWDITAAARGLSVSAVQAVVTHSQDDSFGVDATWPRLIQQLGALSMAYTETEGLEFETADQFQPEIAAMGGVEAWMESLDRDVHHWANRLKLATIEVEAMLKVG